MTFFILLDRRVCSSAGRAAVSKAVGRGFESLRTRYMRSAIGDISNRSKKNIGGSVTSMEVKKAQPIAASSEAPITTARVSDFMGEVKAEVKRISWTSPEELKVYTKIVVAMAFFLGMGIYVVDLLIQSFLNGLGFLFHLLS